MSQLFNGEEVVNVSGNDLECTAVSYQETADGERHSISYTFRLKSDVDAEREAEAKHQEELKAAAEAEAAQGEGTV